MIFGNYSMSAPADEHYFSAGFENGVQAISHVRSLVNLNITNVSGTPVAPNLVWVAIWDAKPNPGSNPAAAGADAKLVDLKPVAGPGWYQFSVHGGQDLRAGLWVGAYSTAALALAGGAPDAGNVLFVRADYNAPKYLPMV